VEVQSTVRTAAPSVLGLHDDAPAPFEGLAEYDRKRKVKSRFQRNIALAVLAAVVILAAFQWYSIRDSVVPYVQEEVRRARQQDVPIVVPPTVPTNNTSPAPVKDSPVVPVAPIASAPGAAELYQAAHASDPRLRVAWLWKAVRAGNSQASVELAKMYEDGEGVTQSCDQARILLTAAAAKGNAQAKLVLKQLQLDEGCAAQ
jgi:TPR repeat protein